MGKVKLKKVWWAITAAYLTMVYLTLGVAPELWDAFDAFLGGKGVQAVYMAGSLACVALLIYMALLKKERSITAYLSFLVFVCIYLILNKLAKFPVEKIHLIEYSGLSFLLFKALNIDVKPYSVKLYILGAAVCLCAGVLDEAIQIFIPNRVFDWRDIALNVSSSITAFMVIRFNIVPDISKRFTRQG